MADCTAPNACGEDADLSRYLEDATFKGVPQPVYACQCKNGTQLVVSASGDIELPVKPPPTVILPGTDTVPGKKGSKGEKQVFAAADYAASLKRFGEACTSVNVTALSGRLVNPDACMRKLRVNTTCGVGCTNTLKAVGYDCYRAAFASLPDADPATINSTPQAVFVQCLNRQNYTEAAKLEEESAQYQAAAAEASQAFNDAAAAAAGVPPAARDAPAAGKSAAPAPGVQVVLLAACAAAAALLLG